MNAFSLTLLVLACILIALGRTLVRRARHGGSRLRQLVGWLFCFAGLLCMIAGVVFWGEIVLR